MSLIVIALAVLWAWEFILVLTPRQIPAPLQPVIVAAMAYGATYLPEKVLAAGAVAGAVAILHVGLRALSTTELPPVQVQQLIKRASGRSNGVGSRVPDLPA